MSEKLRDKIKLLSFSQILILILLFIGGLVSTWFVTKNVATSIYSDRIQEVKNETEKFTSELRERLTRVEDTLFNTQSFFRASNNVSKDELKTFIDNSHIAKNFSAIDSIFFVNKVNTQANTTTEKFIHDIEKNGQVQIVYQTASLSSEDISDIEDTVSGRIGNNDIGDGVLGLAVKRSQRNKHIHFLSPISQTQGGDTIGFVGTSFSLSQYKKGNIGESFSYDLEVLFENKKSISISDGNMGSNSVFLSFLPGFNELSTFENKQSFNFAGANWSLSYHANVTKGAPLWVKAMPFSILLLGLILVTLVIFTLFIIMTDRERVKKEVRKKSKELEKEELKFEAIFNNTLQFIGLLDTDGGVIDTNDTSLRAAGINRKKVLGKKFWNTFWFQNSDEVQNKVESAIKQASSGQVFRDDMKVQTKEGEMWIDLSVKPVYDDNGQIEFLIPEGRNISDRKKTEKELSIKEKALASINEGISISDPTKEDNPLVYTNKAFEELTGYSQDEVIGSNCRFLQGEETSYENIEKMRTAIENEENCDIVIKNYKKNGELFWNDLSIFPVYQEGELVRFIGVQKDITDSKEYEKELRSKVKKIQKLNKKNSEDKARDEAILSSIGENLVVVDQDGKIDFVNDTFENLLGWKQGEVIDKKISEVVSMRDEDGNKVSFKEKILSKVFQEEKSIKSDQDYYFAKEDGSMFPVSITASPIIMNGKVTGAVGVFRDITEIKELDKAKSEFVSLASHQLRTPLTTIRWYSEMLLGGDAGDLSEEQKEFAKEIENGSEQMIGLVNALLNVSRIESGSMLVKTEDVNLQEIAKDVIDELKIKIESKNLNIKENYDQDTPNVKADSRITRIILQNLVSNAVKYTPEEGEVRIDIHPEPEEEKIYIEVSDNGLGIPEEEQDNIFEKMFRADNVKSKDTEGTGLGLYIIKSILNKVGGEIWFESEEGEGTTFYVTLPFSGMEEKEGSKTLAFGEISKEEQQKINN